MTGDLPDSIARAVADGPLLWRRHQVRALTGRSDRSTIRDERKGLLVGSRAVASGSSPVLYTREAVERYLRILAGERVW